LDKKGEVKAVGRTKISERFDPQKYGMIFCPECGGSGRSLTDDNGINVCKVCGGFGLIKREVKKGFQDNGAIAQLHK
jgi:DnaJ-class molecular chaperone